MNHEHYGSIHKLAKLSLKKILSHIKYVFQKKIDSQFVLFKKKFLNKNLLFTNTLFTSDISDNCDEKLKL